MAEMLNKEQKEFFHHVLHLIERSDNCFLSGGVGVGKSLLTKCFYQAAIKCYDTRAGMNFAERGLNACTYCQGSLQHRGERNILSTQACNSCLSVAEKLQTFGFQ